WIGSYTQQYQKVVQSEVTVEAKPDSLFDNVCSTLNLDLKSIVSKPCTSSYPVLCQALEPVLDRLKPGQATLHHCGARMETIMRDED
ncbi:multiple epidermal growth factor-like domains protein 6, partial [Biomphalaria glabrata]